jgi:hypothetical protein
MEATDAMDGTAAAEDDIAPTADEDAVAAAEDAVTAAGDDAMVDDTVVEGVAAEEPAKA